MYAFCDTLGTHRLSIYMFMKTYMYVENFVRVNFPPPQLCITKCKLLRITEVVFF